MTEAEVLVQRFVDQELTADERIRFVAQLGRDAVLREHVIDLERMLIDVGDLDHQTPSPEFVSAVMDQVARPSSRARAIATSLLRPRPMRWSVVGAAAASCVLGLALWAAVSAGRAWGASTSETVSDLEPQQVLVRLMIVDPGARTVEVAGDFNGWEAARTPLRRVSNDAWAVTVPLEPGRYEYKFVVDGDRWVADPFAIEHNSDGFGSENAVIEVSAPVRSPL